jgi:two-component system nitrate/nitrite response regulator NarL
MMTTVSIRVLVVDDDASFRNLAVRLLERAGMTVAGQAGSVGDARECARTLKPAAVLLDIGLPDGDGVTLAGELATLPWQPRIVLTSSDDDVGRADAIDRAGAVFIPKRELTEAAIRSLFRLS